MNKNISTQYYLQQDFGSEQMVLRIFSNKKNVLDFYKTLCENNPKNKYRIIREEILTQVIAESEDYRQALLQF